MYDENMICISKNNFKFSSMYHKLKNKIFNKKKKIN